MSDSTTILDIADNAVKIGLGALIGGLTTIVLARINNKHVSIKAKNDKKYEILEDVVVKIDKFNKSTSLYWVRITDAFSKIDQGVKVSKKETNKIKILEQDLFENFTVISICKAKLLLIGASDASKKLIAYHDEVSEFYRYAHLENKVCNEKSLIDYRDKM